MPITSHVPWLLTLVHEMHVDVLSRLSDPYVESISRRTWCSNRSEAFTRHVPYSRLDDSWYVEFLDKYSQGRIEWNLFHGKVPSKWRNTRRYSQHGAIHESSEHMRPKRLLHIEAVLK